MGLDIYVGSFTRYYSRQWETVCARAAREQGMRFQTMRTNPGPVDRITDPVEIRQAAEEWRSSLETDLSPHLPEGLSWDERAEAEYFTDKPDWVGYSGVVLLAAHTVLPEFPRLDRATEHFDKNPAFQKLAAQEFRCRFSQILQVEVWLPCPFEFTFCGPDLCGHEVHFGSSVALLEQLRQLNDESYRADAAALARWNHDGAGSKDSFDQAAQFGLANFLHHAQLGGAPLTHETRLLTDDLKPEKQPTA